MSIVSKINLLQDNAGTPGEALTSTQLASGTTFWVEIQLQDLHINPSGIVGSRLNLKWDPNSLTATSLTVTNGLPLLRSENITTGNAQVGGGSFPEDSIGKAIGKDKLERFALVLLTTKSNLNTTSSLFTIVADPTGFSTAKGTTILNGSPLIELVNPITTIPENTSTSTAVKVANLSITDDIFGNNTTSLSGSDASSFEIKGNELYLKAGTDLNYNTKNSYSVILSVNDANINKGDSKTFNLSITPVTLPTLSIEATNATQREGDTGIKAFTFTVIRIGDTSSSYTDTNPTLVTATNLGVINERTLSILTSPDTSSFSVGTDPGSNNLVPADVDMYRFELGQAGTISLETSLPQNGAGMDTILRLFDVYGKELGGDDDTGPDFYSRLNAYLKAGTYYFGVSGYANFSYSLTSANSGVEGSNGDYAIKVAFNPNATPFVGDPNGTATGARDIGALSNFAPAGGADILSIIGPDTDLPGVDPTPDNLIAVGDKDVDLIRFTVNPGLVIFQTSNYVPDYIGKFGQIRGKAYLDLLDSDRNGNFDDPIDTVLRLFDASGNELAIDDDSGEGLLSRLEYVFTTAGTYYLGVSGYGNSTYNINTLPDAVDSDLSRRPGSTGSSQLSIILQPNTAPQNPNGGGATTATDADGYIHTNLPSFNLTQTNTGSSNFISLQRNIGNDDQVAVGATDVDFVKVNFQGTGTTPRILTATARGIGTGKSAVMPRVYVFNGQGDRLSAVTSSSSTNTVQISLNPDTDYYVGVAGYGNKNFNPLIMGSGTSAETGNYTLNLSLSGSGANWAVTGSSTNQADATDFGGTLPTGMVSFAAGQTSQTITVNVSGDTTVELDEGFIVTLFNPSGATITTATATGTIQNDDAALAIASTNATQTEGNSSTKSFTFTVTRTGDANNSSSANWAVTGSGTNQADATDFGGTMATGTVNFAANETSKTITVNVSGDTTVEPDEEFTVTLSNPTNATIATATATGIIQNEDVAAPLPTITLAVSPTSVTEDGTTNLVYTFARTGPTNDVLSVNYNIYGTADETDYTGASPGIFPASGKTITFTTGASTAMLTIDPTADTTVESDETVILTLASGTGYTIGTTGAVTGTITNDDLGNTQQITSTSNRLRATPGANLTVPLFYNTSNSNNAVNGIGIRLHYDSTDLSYQQVTNLFSTNLFGSITNGLDTENFDKDNTTDRYIQLQYFATTGNWPNQTLPVKLGDFGFTTSSIFQGTQLNITGVDLAPGYTLEAAPIEIYKQNWTLDVDGNGTISALSDGIIIMRYLFGNFSGDALTRNAIAPNATRTPSEIRTYLGEAGSILDIDGDGAVRPLSDGIMAVRYLFGNFPGNALINGAISPNATRNLSQIESYLGSISGTSSASPLVPQQTTFLPLFAQTFNATSSSKQIIDLTTSNSSLTPGAPVSIGVTYNVDSGDNTLTGIGIRLHYNSNQISYQGASNLLSTDLFGDVTDNLDEQDLDGDTSTNRYIQIQYADFSGNWPNQNLPVKIGDFAFNTVSSFQQSKVNVTAVDVAPGYTLEARPLTLAGDGQPKVISGTDQGDDINATRGQTTVMPGKGDDIIRVNSASVVIIELLNEGNDTVFSSINYNLASLPQIENLTLWGTEDINGIGNRKDNVITGNSGQNVLTGLQGNDTFVFNLGDSVVGKPDRIGDFQFGKDKIRVNGVSPSVLTRASNNSASTLNSLVDSVFIDGNGATSGNQGLGTNSAALVVSTAQGIGGTYLMVNDGVGGFNPATDLVINLTGYSSNLPGLGNIAVGSLFV